MKHGMIKVATATPRVVVADPTYNVTELVRITKKAAEQLVKVLLFPELSITGYTAGDLFFSETLLSGAKHALSVYLKETAHFDLLSIVGLPLVYGGKLYDCGAVCHRGKLLGVVPKTLIFSYGEYGETRYFDAFSDRECGDLSFDEYSVPFSSDLLFTCHEMPELKIALAIGEEFSTLMPPSAQHAAAGATLICNPTASAETVGREAWRRTAISAHAARTLSAYVSVSAGLGESTTDLVFGGHALICEGGTVLAEKKPLSQDMELTVTEVDLQRLCYERRRNNLYRCASSSEHHTVPFSLTLEETVLTRVIDPHPFVPSDSEERARRAETILSIQSAGLKQRVERAYAKKLVLGISGGLDSTLALLVMVRAMDALGRDRKDIIAVTMPCFGTTVRTKTNATVLCEELGVDFRCVDIFDAVNQHFRDIGHDPSVHDVTYENCQARERTQVLMDIANGCGGMVVGTGDLSELALGWATYNGDHMSMYGVNAAIPKTLIRHVVAYCADSYDAQGAPKLASALRDILGTPVSPELLPADENGEIAQKTEDLVGPYELHDFYLYYMLRYGFSPSKLYRFAKLALGEVYDEETLKKWLKTLLRRFFAQQFKRSCVPDGPKVGSVGLSPRGDWRMPSDASSALWIAEAEQL